MVALLYVMLLVGTIASALIIGQLLASFTPTRLVQIVQGAAATTMVLNIIALWKQEPRNRAATAPEEARPSFGEVWALFIARPRTLRLLVTVGLGAAAFTMQDVLLEPYGGQVLGLSVGATTLLTALWALGMLCGFAFAAKRLGEGGEPHRLAGYGAVIGIAAFLLVIFAGPLRSVVLLEAGSTLIGLGGGLFSVGTLTAAMAIADAEALDGRTGLALGAWGAVQATSAGLAIAIGAFARDLVSRAALSGALGSAAVGVSTGYVFVYTFEIVLLVATIVAVGPLVRSDNLRTPAGGSRFGLSEFPI